MPVSVDADQGRRSHGRRLHHLRRKNSPSCRSSYSSGQLRRQILPSTVESPDYF
ncbi:proline-rich receptor-like protein kinase PERK2 [Iris pallida]|uniref:Proline-rich receptor-like protein kinase PERK2 n=1 Tax=Iris pallida TaxID=29817 RepID=A0AAX6FWZ4_IRIPA|nr:proline-rich receptor-like protein kinase PERK2 [Iris pallida]